MKTLSTGCAVFFALVSIAFARPADSLHHASFDLVWQTVNKAYFDPDFGGLDWGAMSDRYRPKIITIEQSDRFIAITNQMLFTLGISHLLVASETMLQLYMPTLFAPGAVGLDIRWIENRAVITRVRDGSPADAAGLRPGYVLLAIDGRKVGDMVNEADVLPPFNERNFRGCIGNYLAGNLDGPAGTSVAIRYLDGRPARHEAVLIRQSRGRGSLINPAMPPVFIDYESKLLPGKIGYIRFNHFAEPVDQQFAATLDTLADTNGLVIDLRGNPGGYFRVMDTMVGRLISAEQQLYQFRFRNRTVLRTVAPSGDYYAQPVAILIDESSMSSSEHFAACLQAIGRAAVIGNHSPGYLVGAQWKRLPNGLFFMYPVLQPVPHGGGVVEGKGVRPDFSVSLSRNGLLAGKDAQLDAAVEAVSTGAKDRWSRQGAGVH